MPYVTDTHALVWYFTQDPRLGKEALEIFRSSASGWEIIVIPIVVLGEIMYISEKGKVPIAFEELLEKIEASDNYEVVALDLELLREASKVGAGLELHDRFIIATARSLNLPLITKDEAIKTMNIVDTVW